MSGTKDKVVVITGASSGIGEATALLLAERGAKVVLGARGSDRLEALAGRIEAAGGEAVYAPTDVKQRGDLSNLVGLAIEQYGKLDVLVNNAGVALRYFAIRNRCYKSMFTITGPSSTRASGTNRFTSNSKPPTICRAATTKK
jgi:NADP-dependent 3-hydroxy acid dehydrogenase YdfG